MRKVAAAALVFAGFVLAVAPVGTVTYGQPDGTRHPYVGVAIQPIPGTEFISVCSGSALSPTVFLTAAHCFDPAQPAYVSFKSGPPFSLATDFVPGTFTPHPEWCFACAPGPTGIDTHDVAVITLARAGSSGPFAILPVEGIVDTLPMKTTADIVGYGVQGFIRGGGQPGQVFLFTRYYAPAQVVQSNNPQSGEFLKLTSNPSQGTGGVCFGDSGGPDLLGGTDTVLAVNSYVGNTNCAGLAYSQRVDLPDILAFINGFLAGS